MFGDDVFLPLKISHQKEQTYPSYQQQESPFDCLELTLNTLQEPLHELENPEDKDSGPSFPDVDFYPTNQLQGVQENSLSFESDSLCEIDNESETSKCQASLSGKVKKLNNTVEYIIKHCLKKILTKKWKSFISHCCQQVGITYDLFVGYWAKKIKTIGLKFFGLNRFVEMVRSKEPEIEVFTYFLTVYLQKDYMTYLITSSIKKKQVYMEEAIRIIYIAQVPRKKIQELLQLAQIGLEL